MATITARALGGSDVAGRTRVTVEASGQPVPIPVANVTLSPSSFALKVNDVRQLFATVEPADATDKRLSWASDNPDVADVNENGLVTGFSSGMATITARALGGSATGSASVTVNDSGQPSGPSDPISVPRSKDADDKILAVNGQLGRGTWVDFGGSPGLANFAPANVGEVLVIYVEDAVLEARSSAPGAPDGWTAARPAAAIQVGVSSFRQRGETALVPIAVRYTLTQAEMIGIFGQDMATVILSNPNDQSQALFGKLSLQKDVGGARLNLVPGIVDPRMAQNYGFLKLTGGGNLTIDFRFLAADAPGAPRVDKDQLIVPDGVSDGVVRDPLWLMKPGGLFSGSGGGCDAGYGAFFFSLALGALLKWRRRTANKENQDKKA
jgi:hypothetical protein